MAVYTFRVIPVLFSIVLSASSISWADTLNQIVEVLRQRENLVESVSYNMTQMKYRTSEGSDLLEQLRPGSVMKTVNPGTPARRDFFRVRQGERDYLKDVHFSQDCATVNKEVFHAWDGSVGKSFVPDLKIGRIEKQKFNVDEELAEKAGLELLSKPLYEWLADPEKATIYEESEGNVIVDIQLQLNLTARYTFNKAKAFVPERVEIIKAGGTAYELSVDDYQCDKINGVDIYFPIKYRSTMYLPRAVANEVKWIPLVASEVTVQNVTYNQDISEEQFTIQFPPDTTVYDEFLDDNLPTLREQNSAVIEAIDNQINSFRIPASATEQQTKTVATNNHPNLNDSRKITADLTTAKESALPTYPPKKQVQILPMIFISVLLIGLIGVFAMQRRKHG